MRCSKSCTLAWAAEAACAAGSHRAVHAAHTIAQGILDALELLGVRVTPKLCS